MSNVVLSANYMEASTLDSLDESTSSSDAGDVLIRATRIPFLNQSSFDKRNFGTISVEPGCNDRVTISVKRLREVTLPSMEATTETVLEQEQTYVPPALPANKPLAAPPEMLNATSSDKAKVQRGDPKVKNGPGEDSVSQASNTDGKQPLSHSSLPGGSMLKGQDVLISQYAGNKEAVRAVLKQRSNSAPLRREVKVQLLNRPSSANQAPQGPPPLLGPQPPALFPGDQGAGAAAAAVTAAALTVTAPLLKAQSELDSQLARFSADLQRLQAVRPQEDRSSVLEQQLHSLTQQRLQHLERIQEQQMELQNRLLGSALDVVTARVPVPAPQASAAPALQLAPGPREQSVTPPGPLAPTTAGAGAGDRAQRGRGRRTPPETPAPRRFAPMPMSRDARARNGQEHLAPDPRKASRPAGGNGRLLEEILNNPKSSGSRTKPAGGQRVAIATAVCQPEPSRAPGQASTAVRKPSSEHPGLGRVLGELPSVPSAAMERASGMLQDLGRLKQEMQTLLQEGRQSPPPGLQTHGKTGSVFLGRVLPGDALGDEGREPAALPPPPPPPPPPPHVSTGEERVHGNLPQPAPRPPPAPPTLLQKSRPPPSMFEDAGKTLRRVQRHKRLLEDNLEAILRAKDGEALHCQLEALCSNRGAKEAVRIKKTVDAWISTLSKEIQAEMGREDSVAQTAERDKGSRGGSPLKGGGAKDLGPLKEGTGAAGSRARPAGRKPFQRGAQGHAPEAQHKHLAPSLKTRGPHQPRLFGASKSEKEDEEYLMKVYGKALYDGHRRTLKKAPYLRFSSPSPKSKPQRPRVVESVRGVKVKSAKTQTSLFPDKTRTIDTEPQYIFSPTRGGHDGPGAPHTALEGLLIPMAIPLGQPRVDGGAPQPSRVIITRRPVTMTASIPPAPPKQASKPNVVVMEVQSERKPKPQLRVQVLPRVDIDSVSGASPAPSSPLPHPPRIQTVEQVPEEDLTVFPGTDYLAVADISQEPEEEFVDTPIELSGSAEPPAAMYHGPAYPPQPSGPPPGTEPILGVIQQRETLENRLVDWVEQQLMARAIAGMCPQRAPVEQASLSEPEESGSDIVEAAGGGGLQYFVDAGVPVDSALIRQYVTDALAETVALMLGQREGQGRPTTPPQPLDVPCTAEVVVPTPVPSPRESPLPLAKEPSPHSTPEPSEQGSTTESPRDLLPPEDRGTGPAGAERSPVATPTITPVSSPPRVATPPALPTPQSMESARHLNPWGDAELPLEEEVPHCDIEDSLQYHRPVVMSVAKEEEPVSLVSVSPPLLPKQPSPPRHSTTPPLLPETPPPASSPSSADSSSSPSVTETDAAGRHISEGELLLSSGPMAAARVMAEEGLTLPAFNTSLSSSLHGVLDIDYDPPSEGQVVRRPRVPHHRDPFLSLLAKMDQGPMLLQEVSHHPEGCWDEDSSAGELSEGQRPRLTAVGESLLTGRSLLDQATLSRPGPGPGPSPGQGGHLSPGQLSLPAGMALGSVQASENPVTLMDLAASPHTEPGARDSEEQASDCIVPARRPAPILVRQYQERPGGTEETDSSFNSGPLSTNANAFFQGEDRDVPFVSTSSGQHSPTTVLVMLPSAEQDRASASVSAVETDSSENDVF
ncbi:protein TALPID3 isoform X2 [Anguilla anguilla]|uniref:protein TALPID3 isoform X2 n=1 Tax=Anguilla anguilla TaxID=7936 RepID=UPI0015A9B0A3|nr:protein TALPID3 isoform X2 [Anguilla anguilla]